MKNPRDTLKKLTFPYLGLKSVETAVAPGYYWNSESQCVVAMKDYDGVLNPIAYITRDFLDERGLQGFIEWESKLWS
jgi:hypothetical protein